MVKKKIALQATPEYRKKMATIKEYKGDPFKTWKWAKELRLRQYEEYARCHDWGGIRVAGGGWSFEPLIGGMGVPGKGVCWLPAEPYAASCGFDTDFSERVMDAFEAHGWAGTMCSYLRNYIGCIYTNEYAFGGPWPKADCLVANHVCCNHAKWKQAVRELEGGDIPFYSVDFSIGPCPAGVALPKLEEHKMRYVENQVYDIIQQADKWLQKNYHRRWDDEGFIKAVKNDMEVTSLWAKVCHLNQAIPAPIDEKTMFGYFTFSISCRTWPEVVDLYRALVDEMNDRIARGVAAVPTEKVRIFGDNPPPWGRLEFYRRCEDYGACFFGSYYTFYLMAKWEQDERGNMLPRRTPMELGIELKTREDAVRAMIDWYASTIHFVPYFIELKNDLILRTAKQWQANAIIMHYNRGCEYQSQSIGESRLAYLDDGFPVMTFEGDMCDHRALDLPRVLARLEAFMESLGYKKLR